MGESGLRFQWERALRESGLPSTVRLVGFVAATYANADGTRVRPGETRLAEATGVSSRTVRRSLASLAAAGYVTRTSGADSRHGRAAEYALTVPTRGHPRPVANDHERTPVSGRDPKPGDHERTPVSGRDQSREANGDTTTGQTGHHDRTPVAAHQISNTRSTPDQATTALLDLDPEELARIAPSFDDDPPPEPERITDGLDGREISARRRAHERDLREQGQDPHGDPINRGSPRYRRRG